MNCQIIGRDGLIIENNQNSGLLLPQVPKEYNWNVEEFLEHTCEKAGIAKNSWKDRDTNVSKFEGTIFKVGTIVENVNTGITSKIVSRGSNYVISIDESENIFRSWLKDLVEQNDLKGFDFSPAGEMGTDNLTNYMKKLTPGEFIKKINKKDKTSQ